MSKPIEAIIAEPITRAVKFLLQPIEARLTRIEAMLAKMSVQTDAPSEPMKLITLQEAQKRLIVNPSRLKELIDGGDLATVTTPGGRRKVVESSLNNYINLMIKEGAA